MHRSCKEHRIGLPSIALALVASTCHLAVADERIQLRVPQSFQPVPTVTERNEFDDQDDPRETRAPGDVELVRERYPNGNVRIERHVTLDADGNYVNHGVWRMWTATGEVIAEGQFEMGQRVGVWTRTFGRNDAPALSQFPFKSFKPPFTSQAMFVDGVMDGEWLIVDADQRKCMQISFSGGERNGHVISWLPNGKTYQQSMYDRGVPVGDVMEIDTKTGELKQVATYVEGRRMVTKTAHYNQGKQKKTEESFLAATTVEKSADDFWMLKFAEYTTEGKDLRHGPSKSWFENGAVRHEGYYERDKKSGTFTYWYANGQIAVTGEYRDDLPDDVWVWWHDNGQKAAVGKYGEGSLIGEWRWWHEDGKLAVQKAHDGTQSVTSNPQDTLRLGRAPEPAKLVR